MDFLSELFANGLSHSSINTAKAALLTCVTVDGRSDWNKDPDMSRFCKGVDNSRPSRPRLLATWDVDIVLNYLGKLPTDNISLKDLTHKAAMLVALTSGSRAQSIHEMNLDNMVTSGDKLVFFFDTPLKTSRTSKTHQMIEIKKMDGNKCCVYSAVAEYIRRTKDIRPPSTKALWISLIKPHGAVTRDSISRWLKEVLTSAKIDTEVFKAHSTRSASTSKANNLGVGLSSSSPQLDGTPRRISTNSISGTLCQTQTDKLSRKQCCRVKPNNRSVRFH